jgi:uncharacterized membrane protein
MNEQTSAQLVKQLANLRLQVSALEDTARSGSLPGMLKQTRRTILWSAVLVAIALLGSSVIRVWSDTKARSLEQRVEQLEHDRKAP